MVLLLYCSDFRHSLLLSHIQNILVLETHSVQWMMNITMNVIFVALTMWFFSAAFYVFD